MNKTDNFYNTPWALTSLMILVFVCLMASCSSDDASVDCTLVNITVNANPTNSDCPEPTGSITVTATGGEGNFEYSLDGQSFQSANVFQNVAGGNYTVMARDANGCTADTAVVVASNSDIMFTTVSNVAAGCGGNAGSLTVIASGGDGNYRYSVNNGAFQDGNEFSNLSNGLHIVTVTDGDNCQTSGEGYVISGISYNAEVATIITTYCSVPGCHVNGGQPPDLSVFTNVQAAAAEIKKRTRDGSMPRGSTLTDEQIAAIACWVDDGALDN